jgi:hypothetical protein
LLVFTCAPILADDACFLSDPLLQPRLRHQQQWGDFGIDTAAAAAGRPGSPMQIGQQTYARGLGHHANGEIVIELQGQFSAFCAALGVQWQGGNRGSVVFRVLVDGRNVLETDPISDSDPPRPVEIALAGARELRLVAGDGGDGIGCDMANWAEARLVHDPKMPLFHTAQVTFGGQSAPAPSQSMCGLALIADQAGPQVLLTMPANAFSIGLEPGEEVCVAIAADNLADVATVSADVSAPMGGPATVELGVGEQKQRSCIGQGQTIEMSVPVSADGGSRQIVLATRAAGGPTGVRWRRLRCQTSSGQSFEIPLMWPPADTTLPAPKLPDPRPFIQQELITWDWQLQDGIGTPREASTYLAAVGDVLQQGDRLIAHLLASGVALDGLTKAWEASRQQWQQLSAAEAGPPSASEDLWLRVHDLRRQIVFQNPLAQFGPLLFVKRVPSSFSHQLTQYYGRAARPGGGVFVLDAPGRSMRCRQLADLPMGSYLHPEVSYDGRRVLFAFCETDADPGDYHIGPLRYYHLFEMATDGSGLRQLTDGPYDDFAPRYLPDGKIVFISTRRGGFHRCGRGPCPVYTLTIANADGSQPQVISYHETHEWDPAVLNDGRIIYTRWDYVDRHAVHYQQLWAARPDGSNVTAYYGNNTLNPVGVWEARPVPGSARVMATAAAHHAMTAGSIILLDVTRGIDGLDPITRLTPDALFPESECRVLDRWHAPFGVPQPPPVPIQQRRWPGHCYRTPLPLSEDFFLAAYSYAPLIGEPQANAPNMFGIYLVDRFGNRELIYRDLSIGSLWPTPLAARPRPPAVPRPRPLADSQTGTFLVQNVRDSWPALPAGNAAQITRLRIVQVLPKTTPHANTPRVGLANASPGKQVLGTVPVQADGSAYFTAPAGVPLAFQALDARGMAVQTMRSLTYLQPGEQTACIGCHEHRSRGPDIQHAALAARQPPSPITPGPDGARPLSFPVLVQPVLDRHCTSCHSGPAADGGVVLTGEPAGAFTASYLALAPWVAYSEWKSTPEANAEPLTHPDQFGARASRLTALLKQGHADVILSDDDWERLATWMDANALFYGTFDPEDQRRQQLGQRIAGPALE